MIWVEILTRHRDVTARFRCAGPVVRIGRGYDNDVVLDDPYVAVNHVVVFRDDAGRLVGDDRGSVNGMFLDRDRTRQERIVIDGERPIRIGHTYLRIREASHAVEPERAGRSESRAFPIVLAAALGVAILAIEVVTHGSARSVSPGPRTT
jgi:pSer/pThr/pTyr-binding forkhead associated (FHA) protein